MSSKICEKDNLITPELILRINHSLRSLGIKTGRTGYKVLIEAIKIAIINYDETNFTDIQVLPIYKEITVELKINKTPKQVERMIYYAITHRNNTTCNKNFEKVFGYSFDEEIFSNKEFINEFVNMLKLNGYC